MMIVKAKGSQDQLTRMQEIVGQLKKGKDSASKKVKSIEAALETFIDKIRVYTHVFLNLVDKRFFLFIYV